MSVPSWERETDDLNVAMKAEALLMYTITKMQGAKGKAYFTKADTFKKTLPLLQSTEAILHNIMKANDLHINEWEYAMRRKYQVLAKCAIRDVRIYLTTFNDQKPIDNLEYWAGLINDLLKSLNAWIKADELRYTKYMQENEARKVRLERAFENLKSVPFGTVEDIAKVARNQFLRSPNVSNANNVRNVNASTGALNNNNANNANAEAPDCMDSQTE